MNSLGRVLAQLLTPPAASLHEIGENPSIRPIEIAWTVGTAADSAFLVILLLIAYKADGALAAGILGAVRIVPAIFAAPFATSVVERVRGDAS
jgi:hypothetical protein